MGVAAGWYDDPNNSEYWRWWDGRAWGPRTEKTPGGDMPAPPVDSPKRPSRTAQNIAKALAALAVVFFVLPVALNWMVQSLTESGALGESESVADWLETTGSLGQAVGRLRAAFADLFAALIGR
jgi:hypothetical protein